MNKTKSEEKKGKKEIQKQEEKEKKKIRYDMQKRHQYSLT